MDFEQGNNTSQPQQPEPQLPLQPAIETTQPPQKRGFGRIFKGIYTAFACVLKLLIFLMLIALIGTIVSGRKGGYTEEVIQAGPAEQKIAVINLIDMIDYQRSKDVCRQLKIASEDPAVKGVIVRINSPGGLVSSSDQIYHEILKYREGTGNPAIAFMQTVAASGGYYVSVACDKILAEPTVITGSVGVILGYLVVEEFLEGKLGIQPVVVKSGEKKDWPSSFRPPTEEELKYLDDKIIIPAYERFVQLIATGRESLSLADVRRLADGSIYNANEALENGLIDNIGYFEDAFEMIKKLAGIEKARVVEYKKPLSLMSILAGVEQRKSFKINKSTLYDLTSLDVMYLWRGY